MNYPTFTDSQVSYIFSSIPLDLVAKMQRQFTKHMATSKQRGIPFEFSFQQWAAIWWASGNWHLRGNTKDKPFMMCRKDDTGSYSIGNVRIDTIKSNMDELRANKAFVTALSNSVSISNRVHKSKSIVGTNILTGDETIWPSVTDAAKALDINHQCISAAARGRYKSSAGYFWRYA